MFGEVCMKHGGFILLFFLPEFLFAQSFHTLQNTNKQAQKFYNDAMASIARNQYAEAGQSLKDAVDKDSAFIDAWLLLSEMFYDEGNFQKSIFSANKAIQLHADYSTRSYYFLAKSCWQLNQFDSCVDACNQYLSQKSTSPERKSEMEKLKRNAAFSKVALQHPVPFNPKPLGDLVNSTMPEYLPSITGDEQTIVFTRRTGSGRMAQEDFFSSEKINGQWREAVGMKDINTDYNEGAQSMTPDGSTLYFASCDRPDGYGSCDLYFSYRTGTSWTKPQNVGAPVSTAAWESQPSISADGNALYFVSTRKGGKGGSDIWVAYKDSTGHWQEPLNLGDSINTSGDEKSPFIHADGQTLYFASNGWPGFGGDDLFVSHRKADGSWSTPGNLGYPINTRNDENSLVVSLNGKHAYFATDRLKQKGDMDLYEFDLYEDARPLPTTYVSGMVTDAQTRYAVKALIEIIDLDSDRTVMKTFTDSKTGNYLVALPCGNNFAFHVSANGYLFHSENYSLNSDSCEKNYHLNIALQPVAIGKSVVLKNIFFKTDSYELLPASVAELQTLILFMKQNASVHIEIDGHTDNVGTDQHNQQLSTNRAKAVYDYLSGKGIDAKRLSYKGFGKSKPVASNDSEAGRSQNRRTEFVITAK